VESLPNSAAVKVLKGIIDVRDAEVLINVTNLTNVPRKIRKGQAFAVYTPMDMTQVNVVSLDITEDNEDPIIEVAATSDRPVIEAASARQYAETHATLAESDRVDTKTVTAMRELRPNVNWDGIPEDLNIGRGTDDITDGQFNALTDIIRTQTNRGLFSQEKNPGQVRPEVAVHEIDTGNAKPVNFPPRQSAPSKRRTIEEETRKMLDYGIIEPSRSPWAAPVVIAAKKDGGVRLCVDYRELNKVTKKDGYPLPRIDDTVDALNGAKYLTAFDMLAGYWQVQVAPADREKTASSPTKDYINGSGCRSV
jgi:hypothetical protein